MWGIIPAAGSATRIQPLAFSKELLPVGSRIDDGRERPRAVSEYLVERMILGGVDKIGFVVAPEKMDIPRYFGDRVGPAALAYLVQPRPGGLCDAVFRAVPFVPVDEPVVVGLPDTVWFPESALKALPNDRFAFLLFPVDRPDRFDAVLTDAEGRVREIQVKRPDAGTHWIWGAFKMPGAVLHDLHRLWLSRGCQDQYIGTLVNAYLEAGGGAWGIRAGEAYVDVGTVDGYRAAISLLSGRVEHG